MRQKYLFKKVLFREACIEVIPRNAALLFKDMISMYYH